MKVGRNDLCPCGSGKKYKKCCMGKESEVNHSTKLASQHDSLDQINYWMQEGHDDFDSSSETNASEKWLKVWQETLHTDIMELTNMTTPQLSHFYINWVQDFEMALGDAEQSDSNGN